MKIIGLLSGTSADGIDCAICDITGQPPQLHAEIIYGTTTPYNPQLRERILAASQKGAGSVDELCLLNVQIAEAFAHVAAQAILQADLSSDDIDLIASHGQNVWHHVRADGHVDATLQIGEASVIAERSGITTISNFRARDVAAGGQGAPLVGYMDWVLLRHPTRWRAIQNIGGIGNMTILPPLSDNINQPLAFDTGPGNALIDSAMEILTDGRQTYDDKGQLAGQGTTDKAWLQQLLQHPYFELKPPKTTGRELFSPAMAADLIAEGQSRGLSTADIVATITALTAHSIVDACKRFSPAAIQEVILAGGGQHNLTLYNDLQTLLAPVPVHTHDIVNINNDYKEALLFSVLAYETWHNRPSTLPALTGAKQPVVLGQITPGKNYLNLIQKTWNVVSMG